MINKRLETVIGLEARLVELELLEQTINYVRATQDDFNADEYIKWRLGDLTSRLNKLKKGNK